MNQLDYQDGLLILSCPPREREFAKECPGLLFKAKLDAYVAPASWTTALVIQNIFTSRGLEVTQAVTDWLATETANLSQLLSFKASAEDNGIVIEAANGDRLYPWQANDALAASMMKHVIDDSVTGSGKTAKYLSAIRIAEAAGKDPFPVLWVTRPMTQYQHAEEVANWLPGKSCEVVTKGMTPANRKKLLTSGADVIIIPWHLLQLHSRLERYGNETLTDKQKLPGELNDRFHTVVLDEAHKALDPSTNTTKAMWAVVGEAEFRFVLTNTPMEKAPDELWTLQRAIEPKNFTSSTRYKERYCQMAPQWFGPDICIGLNPLHEAEWRAIWNTMSISRGEEVLGDLPPKLYHDPYYTDMEGKQKSAYNKFDENSLLVQGDFILSATNPLVKRLRLLQLACATPVLGLTTIKDPETGEVRDCSTIESYTMPSNKVDFMLECVERFEGKSLVFFMDDRKLLELCATELTKKKIEFVEFKGGMKDRIREAGRHEFQSGSIKIALCMFQVAAEGLTFTASSTIIYLQRDDSSIASEQSEGRTRRIGQTADTCEYLDHVTRDSEEPKVHQNYLAKIKARNTALGRTTEVRDFVA